MNIWAQIVLGLIIALVVSTIIFFVFSSFTKRTTNNSSPSTPSPASKNGRHDDNSTTSGDSGFFNNIFNIIGLFVILAFLCLGLRGCCRWLNKPSATQQQVAQSTNSNMQQVVPHCYTPCTLYRRLNQNAVWELGMPMNTRLVGESNWTSHPGKEKIAGVQNVSTEEFPPGLTEFDSPGNHVYVEIDNK
jgi:flagellar basal body-associated protein FliL